MEFNINYFKDLTLIGYTLNALVSGFGFFLFIWWWRKVRKASIVYKYLTFIFLGMFIDNAIMWHVRILSFTDHLAAENCLYSWFWKLRTFLILIPLTLLIGSMIARLLRTYKVVKNFLK